MSRSLKRSIRRAKIIEKLAKSKQGDVIKTWARRSVISPEMVGFTAHNGKIHISVFVSKKWSAIVWENFLRQRNL